MNHAQDARATTGIATMTEHLTERDVELYRRREAAPANRELIATHLAVCGDCLKRVLDPSDAALAINSLNEAFLPKVGEEPFHLSLPELKSYHSGNAMQADQVICESHIEACDSCRENLRQLSAPLPFAAPFVKATQLKSGWRRQVASAFAPARLAAAIALVGLLIFAIVLWRQRSVSTISESARTGSPDAAPSRSPANESPANPPTEVNPSNQILLAGLQDNNREIRLDREGKLTGLEGFDESSQRMARAALTGEALSKPSVLDGISSPPIRLLGEPESEQAFQLIGPIGRVVMEQHPSLKWRKLRGASGYTVSVFDANFNRVVQSPRLTEPAWTVTLPLTRGRTYSWEVSAIIDGKEFTAPVAPAPRAQFRMLEAEQLNTLAKLKERKPSSHLALGLTYARFGLVSDAEREFRQLVKENPDSALAKKLLRTVQSWQR